MVRGSWLLAINYQLSTINYQQLTLFIPTSTPILTNHHIKFAPRLTKPAATLKNNRLIYC